MHIVCDMDELKLLSAEDVERLAAEAGVPLKDIFEKADISHTTFYRWRKGDTRPTLDVYERIVNALRSLRSAA